MSRLQRLTYRVWFVIGVLVLTAVTLWLLYRPLAVVLAPLLFAFLIVYLLNPVVSALERRRVPRLVGTAVTYVTVLAGLTGLSALVVPVLSAQLSAFVAEAPDLGTTFTEGLGDLLARFGVDLDLTEILDPQAVSERLQRFASEENNLDTILSVLAGLSGLARGAFFVLFTLLVGPVFAFYILVDLPRFRSVAVRLVPPNYRAELSEVGAKLGRVVGGFIRGQLVIAVFVGVASSVVLALVGLRFWLVIGVIAGITNLVPLIGPLVAGALGVVVALLTEGLGQAVLVAVGLTAIQQVDSNVMSPLVMGRTVRIHPFAVLLGILVAGMLYGVFGMLVAVPLVAGAKVLAQHVWDTRVPWAAEDRHADESGAHGRDPPGEHAEAAVRRRRLPRPVSAPGGPDR